jgi:transposase-like protein
MTTKKPKKQKAAYPFLVELIDQLLARVENKDAESILGESGLAGQLKKMVAERTLTAELSHRFIPRGRLSSFEPKLLAKHQRRMQRCGGANGSK